MVTISKSNIVISGCDNIPDLSSLDLNFLQGIECGCL